ncbi:MULTISPECIES: sporulation integral membrane protein YtvI [Eubacteriales]|uniref:Sporulation integral membrane protein YtvI n=1 Tax=Clostridium isatidis TaxID=182773 RepID=A0A343J9R2_9CLOT|nr:MULTISPECIES: sporulation integral membrane protein YtvI [Eubacteriales]ASW42270.1 sporulation integral membrane protein YtvI [Clostridium isatidis]MBU5454432.1 sporulation integral membrane protein YtvI [Caproiciproducens sp. MSJ-32]NLZ35252.1 sporulation integral membrane protein YtvI [Clostridiales bacterium]
MSIEKKKNFIINVIYIIALVSIVYGIFKYAIPWLMPFVIGFSVAFILKPVITLVSDKYKISRKLTAGILVTLFYLIVGALITLLIIKLSMSIKDLFLALPSLYMTKVEPAVYEITYNIENLISKLDPELVKTITDILLSLVNSLGSLISNLSTTIVKVISSAVSAVPGFFIIVLFSIISSYFFALDYKVITGFIEKQLPEKTANILFQAKEGLGKTILKFIKSYSIIITITFFELFVGLMLLRVEKAATIAFIIAIFDILPILGAGGILIPWAIIELIKGEIFLGIGIFLMYILITVIRNIIEPKIVGKEVGLHPIIMLICIYLGINLFGFIGIFVLPITMTVLINLNRSGKIKLFK